MSYHHLPYITVPISTGLYLPEKIVTNDDLKAMGVDTTHEWIYQRTGIIQRHFAANDEMTSDLGYKAACDALNKANISPDDIDLIILATTTADNTFPATATKIQQKLNNKNAAAFDVQAVCSGFIFALNTAANFLRIGQHKRALVIGAEIYSRILNFDDRSSCVLFGDGAGCIILEAQENTNQDNFYHQSGLYSECISSDGQYYDSLYVNGGIAKNQQSGYVVMKGQEVYRHAIVKMSQAVKNVIASTAFSIQDIDWLVPHQANARIIEKVGEELGIPIEKTIFTVQDHANTSAATIPIACAMAEKNNQLQKGNLIAFTALGGGFSWGACLLRW